MQNEVEALAILIANAARKSFTELFNNKESFYYCSLITTGEALAPIVSAWSREALAKEVAKLDNSDDGQYIKWSYADSPYFNFAYEDFEDVRKAFSDRIKMDHALADTVWRQEYEIRIEAVVLAMELLDKEGLFSLNQKRDQICVLVEVMPPDETNTMIGLRLNDCDSQIMKEWLVEIAE